VLEPHKYFPEFLMHVAELYGVDPGGFTLVGLGHNGTMATRLALSAPQMIESMILVPELTPDYVAIQEAATHLRTPVVIFVSVEDRELVRSQQAEQLVNSGKIEVRFVRVESTMRNGLIQSIPSVIDYIESSASTGARSDDSDGPVS
jgi:pimeloyl-ACP methyl ester carboxylesterase